MLLVSLNKFTFIHRICFSRFNGASFEPEPSSMFSHYHVYALGSYRNCPFVTGSFTRSRRRSMKTERLDYKAGKWIQEKDYPFSNLES